jgi:hypothetical protein
MNRLLPSRRGSFQRYFGNRLALVHAMNNRGKLSMNEEEWRKLCEQVANEPDPQRLSELLDQLLKKLDSRRETLREIES